MTDPIAADTLLFPEALKLLDCLCTALDALGVKPGICCIRAGDSTIEDMGPFYDECCEGLAYVRIDGFYATGFPGNGFPSPSSDVALNGCAPYAWGVQLEMGVFRCISSDQLSCAEWTGAAASQMLDAKAMRQALCCFMSEHDSGDVSVGSWTPKGRDGGCIGGTMPVSVQVINCPGGC